MQVAIYRSSVKDGLYVFVKTETKIESLPPPVLKQLGDPEKAMELELKKDTKLSNANAAEVIDAIESQRCYIQMPHDIETLLARVAGTQSVPSKE